MKINLVTVVGTSIETLDQMLSHYQNLGITTIRIHINANSCEDELVDDVRRLAGRWGAEIASVNVIPWSESINPLLYTLSRTETPDEWFILADADEFQVYPDALGEILKYCNERGYDFVEGCFVDRVAADGSLTAIVQGEDLWSQFPLGGCLSGPLLGAVINKVVAARGHVRVGRGQHHAHSGIGCPVSEFYIPVHHFKWTSGLPARLETRSQIYKLLGEKVWQESDRFLAYFSAEKRIRIEDERFLFGLCNPEYPFWNRLRQWRVASYFFRSC
jgi:hypothetical protein